MTGSRSRLMIEKLSPAVRDRISRNLLDFVSHLNARRYRDALLAMEECWFEDRNEFYRGLIQFCNALNQMELGAPTGPQFLLRRARERLSPFAPNHERVPVTEVVRFIEECERLVQANPKVPMSPPAFLLKLEDAPA